MSVKIIRAFLALRFRKISSLIALIFDICVKFLNEFLIVSLVLLPSLPTTSLSSALNAFGIDFFDDLIVFNKKVTSTAILLKL